MFTSSKIFLVVYLLLVIHSASLVWSTNMRSIFEPNRVLQVHGKMDQKLIESITTGAQLAMEHCQHIFKWDRWNCPDTTFTRRSKLLPTKEIAFTKAIISAGIVYAITRNCSKGLIRGCSCEANLGGPNPVYFNRTSGPENMVGFGETKRITDWTWGSCSDNPKYALDITKKFLDSIEEETGVSLYIGKHNSKVGREIVRETMIKKCRCHGVSGSCSLQTCWLQMAPFGDISKKLKERYRTAIRVSENSIEKSIILGNSAREDIEEKNIPVNKQSLAFLERSPDYCVANNLEDYPGTKGRACSRNLESSSPSERRSCRHLCKKCGYAVKRLRKTVSAKCNCKFVWCCNVQCDVCEETVEEYFCD